MEPRDEELKQSGEVGQEHESAYEEAVAFLKESPKHFNEKQLPFVVDQNFIDAVIKQAEAGEITTTKLDQSGKKELVALTPRELLFDYFDSFVTLHDRRDPKAFNEIPRAGGLREAMRAISGDKRLASALKLAILQRQVAMNREEQSAGPEVMDQQEREEVVEELGEEATGAVVVDPGEAVDVARRMIEIPDFIKNPTRAEAQPVTPEAPKLTKDEYLKKLTDGFSEADIRGLVTYAEDVAALNRAQRKGEYGNAAAAKRDIFESRKMLSSAAQAVADQYAHAYNHY